MHTNMCTFQVWKNITYLTHMGLVVYVYECKWKGKENVNEWLMSEWMGTVAWKGWERGKNDRKRKRWLEYGK